jgi:hypothetical protein
MEINMEKEKQEIWTIEELVSMTETVQSRTLMWHRKGLNIQWCELTEEEEPKMIVPDDNQTSEEQSEYFKKIAGERVLAMISKANKKEPEAATIDADNWGSMPTTLRWNISSEILGTLNESFTSG